MLLIFVNNVRTFHDTGLCFYSIDKRNMYLVKQLCSSRSIRRTTTGLDAKIGLLSSSLFSIVKQNKRYISCASTWYKYISTQQFSTYLTRLHSHNVSLHNNVSSITRQVHDVGKTIQIFELQEEEIHTIRKLA